MTEFEMLISRALIGISFRRDLVPNTFEGKGDVWTGKLYCLACDALSESSGFEHKQGCPTGKLVELCNKEDHDGQEPTRG